eukprot:g37892.t1
MSCAASYSRSAEMLDLQFCVVWLPWFRIVSVAQLAVCAINLWLLWKATRAQKSNQKQSQEFRPILSWLHPYLWIILYSVSTQLLAILRLVTMFRVQDGNIGINALFAFNWGCFWMLLVIFLFKYVEVAARIPLHRHFQRLPVHQRTASGHGEMIRPLSPAFYKVRRLVMCLVGILSAAAFFLGRLPHTSYATVFWAIFLGQAVPFLCAFLVFVRRVQLIVLEQLEQQPPHSPSVAIYSDLLKKLKKLYATVLAVASVIAVLAALLCFHPAAMQYEYIFFNVCWLVASSLIGVVLVILSVSKNEAVPKAAVPKPTASVSPHGSCNLRKDISESYMADDKQHKVTSESYMTDDKHHKNDELESPGSVPGSVHSEGQASSHLRHASISDKLSLPTITAGHVEHASMSCELTLTPPTIINARHLEHASISYALTPPSMINARHLELASMSDDLSAITIEARLLSQASISEYSPIAIEPRHLQHASISEALSPRTTEPEVVAVVSSPAASSLALPSPSNVENLPDSMNQRRSLMPTEHLNSNGSADSQFPEYKQASVVPNAPPLKTLAPPVRSSSTASPSFGVDRFFQRSQQKERFFRRSQRSRDTASFNRKSTQTESSQHTQMEALNAPEITGTADGTISIEIEKPDVDISLQVAAILMNTISLSSDKVATKTKNETRHRRRRSFMISVPPPLDKAARAQPSTSNSFLGLDWSARASKAPTQRKPAKTKKPADKQEMSSTTEEKKMRSSKEGSYTGSSRSSSKASDGQSSTSLSFPRHSSLREEGERSASQGDEHAPTLTRYSSTSLYRQILQGVATGLSSQPTPPDYERKSTTDKMHRKKVTSKWLKRTLTADASLATQTRNSSSHNDGMEAVPSVDTPSVYERKSTTDQMRRKKPTPKWLKRTLTADASLATQTHSSNDIDGMEAVPSTATPSVYERKSTTDKMHRKKPTSDWLKRTLTADPSLATQTCNSSSHNDGMEAVPGVDTPSVYERKSTTDKTRKKPTSDWLKRTVSAEAGLATLTHSASNIDVTASYAKGPSIKSPSSNGKAVFHERHSAPHLGRPRSGKQKLRTKVKNPDPPATALPPPLRSAPSMPTPTVRGSPRGTPSSNFLVQQLYKIKKSHSTHSLPARPNTLPTDDDDDDDDDERPRPSVDHDIHTIEHDELSQAKVMQVPPSREVESH